MVGEGGFEPPKASPTDLQSAPFGHSGIPPYEFVYIFFACDEKYTRLLFILPAFFYASNPKPAVTMELVDGLEPPTC